MKKVLMVLACVAAAACGPVAVAVADEPNIGALRGVVKSPGGSDSNVYIMTVNGTKCISIVRYNSVALSCDWGKQQ